MSWRWYNLFNYVLNPYNNEKNITFCAEHIVLPALCTQRTNFPTDFILPSFNLVAHAYILSITHSVSPSQQVRCPFTTCKISSGFVKIINKPNNYKLEIFFSYVNLITLDVEHGKNFQSMLHFENSSSTSLVSWLLKKLWEHWLRDSYETTTVKLPPEH